MDLGLNKTESIKVTTQTKDLSRKKKLAFSLIALLIPAAIIFGIYIVYTAYRTRPLYEYIKSHQRGWRGYVHRTDTELGFAPVPGSQGAEVFPIGDEVPARYDKDGFRVPLNEEMTTPVKEHPILLSLGDSFTYGAAVPAEDAFTYLVGRSLGGPAKNAGVSSYGLSQMLIVAKRLVPIYKPDYLLVQYSPWLAGRAQNPFAQTYFGKLPTPYFFVSQSNLRLHPPVFKTKILDLPTDKFRNTPASFIDRVSFLWDVGLPLFAHDDLCMSSYNISKVFGRIPEAATNSEQITRYVYEEITRLARENGARVFIVVLGIDDSPVPIREELFPNDAVIINAQAALSDHLTVKNNDNYAKAYYHWRGTPLRMVDPHPNETAHRIIADAILQKIRAQIELQPDKMNSH